jgi:hypothetical protein
MRKVIKKLDWIFDYYFVYFLYGSNKQQRYIDYMKNKWGTTDGK